MGKHAELNSMYVFVICAYGRTNYEMPKACVDIKSSFNVRINIIAININEQKSHMSN